MRNMPIQFSQGRSHALMSFVIIAIMACAERADAQAQAVQHFRCDALVDGASFKRIAEGLKRLDERVLLSADGDYLKVRIDASIPHEVLLRALNEGPRRFHAMSATLRPNDFPTRMDTGDPAGDDQRHAAAKQAWIAAHPKEYQLMLGDPSYR